MKVSHCVFTLFSVFLALANSCAQGGFSGKNQPKKTKDNAAQLDKADSGGLNGSDARHSAGAEGLAVGANGGTNSGTGTNSGNAAAIAELLCAPKSIKINNLCVVAKPVYRWFSSVNNDHFYTMAAGSDCMGKTSLHSSCGGEVVNEGKYVYEGIEFYTLENTEPIHALLGKMFRLYNPDIKKHFYTISAAVADNYVKNGGYKLEGWYLSLPLSAPVTKSIHFWHNTVSGDNFYSFFAGPDCAGKTALHPSCGGDGVSKKGEVVNEQNYAYIGIAGTFYIP